MLLFDVGCAVVSIVSFCGFIFEEIWRVAAAVGVRVGSVRSETVIFVAADPAVGIWLDLWSDDLYTADERVALKVVEPFGDLEWGVNV